jgi:hypothetical protein
MANPLREAVKQHFYPFAESKGFDRAKSTHPHFTTFRRIGPDIVHIFDVQWDKYGRARFVLNFGEAERGLTTDALEVQDCKVLCRLQPGRNSPRWWRLMKPWTEMLRTGRFRYTPEEVVDQVIASFAEVEAWWSEKMEGPHVHVLWRRAG